MSPSNTENESKKFDPKDTGTEYNSHMTADGAPGSHSAAFGLASKDGKSSEGKQPGDVIANEQKAGSTDTDSKAAPAKPEGKTGGMADGSSDNTLPGAGSTQATAEQGTGKV